MHLKITITAFSIALAAITAVPSLAAEPVTVAIVQIPGLAESKEKGVFVDFTKEVAKRTGLNVDYDVLPGQRAFSAYNSQERLAIAPVVAERLSGEYHRTPAFFQKHDYVFVKKGSAPINDLKSLEGKKVGLTAAYVYPAAIKEAKAFTTEAAASDVLNMKKLEAGRIDAFIAESASGLAAAKEAGVADMIERSPTPLYSLDVFYAFNPTPAGKAASDVFSKAIDSMAQDGTLKKMFAPPQ